VKFSQPPKIGDVIVSRVHTWWLDSYDVLNQFGMKLTDEIIYDCTKEFYVYICSISFDNACM